MNSYQTPLPPAWMARIFSAMQGYYGTRYTNMWKTGELLPNGEDAGHVNMMRVWAEKLGGFQDHPECIAHALENLPDNPPTLPVFLDLCRKAPRKEPLKLVHTLTQEEVNRNKERLEALKRSLEGRFNADRQPS
jgi:hypothetical protein